MSSHLGITFFPSLSPDFKKQLPVSFSDPSKSPLQETPIQFVGKKDFSEFLTSP